MNILFAASECGPYVKTGGLADVVGSLPAALTASRRDAKVIVILPKYAGIKQSDLQTTGLKLMVPIGGIWQPGTIWQSKQPNGSVCYFIENDYYFNRPGGIYSDDHGDYADNAERFIFYQRAVLEACKLINFVPDVVHCHDWHTGLIPVYLKTLYAQDSFFTRTSSLFTIHNIAYQGIFDRHTLSTAGLSADLFTPAKLEFFGQLNFMKAALVYADFISTVSPSYAREILDAQFGRGMEGILQQRQNTLQGILNGLDQQQWDPAQDPFIKCNFSVSDNAILQAKQDCKKAVQQQMGLQVDGDAKLVAMVSRLDVQKGFQFLAEIVPALMVKEKKLQWAVLGKGDKTILQLLQSLAARYPGRFALDDSFNEPLGHQIYAGSDIFFMPSLFEPCGISQLIALRYGSIPVVAATGGLKDTIFPWDGKNGTGFLAQGNAVDLERALCNALHILGQNQQELLMRNSMQAQFSWVESAQQYWHLYDKISSRHD